MFGMCTSPTIPCVIVSVMPHQPIVFTPKCASVGGSQIALPHRLDRNARSPLDIHQRFHAEG